MSKLSYKQKLDKEKADLVATGLISERYRRDSIHPVPHDLLSPL